MTPEMTCPYCGTPIPLTLRRYWSAPFGRHRCAACGGLSKLSHTASYYVGYLVQVGLLVVAPTWFLLLPRWNAWDPVFWLALTPFALASFEMDRHLDGRVRPLRPLAGGEPASQPPEDLPLKRLDHRNPYAAPITDEIPPRR